jgi:hypothetical protein
MKWTHAGRRSFRTLRRLIADVGRIDRAVARVEDRSLLQARWTSVPAPHAAGVGREARLELGEESSVGARCGSRQVCPEPGGMTSAPRRGPRSDGDRTGAERSVAP